MLGGILLLGYQGYYLNTTGKPVESIVNPNIQPNSNIPNHKMGEFVKIGDPQVSVGFNTKSWSSMTWMIWRYPHDVGNLQIPPSNSTIVNPMKCSTQQ